MSEGKIAPYKIIIRYHQIRTLSLLNTSTSTHNRDNVGIDGDSAIRHYIGEFGE